MNISQVDWWQSDNANLHWRRVTKCLAEITSDFVLGRKIDLLEEFWRDGNAAGCTDFPQGSVGIHIAVKVVALLYVRKQIYGLQCRYSHTIAKVLLKRAIINTPCCQVLVGVGSLVGAF